jgi:hypothetical protein
MMYPEAFMRRSGFFAGLAILAAAVSLGHAQGTVVFHGIPASVTSITPQNPTPGIPASVTSQTVLPIPSPFSRPFFVTGAAQPFFHHRHRMVAVPVPVPVYYPFYSYPVTYGDDTQAQPEPQPVVDVEETPAPAIYEKPAYEAPVSRSSYTPPADSKPRDNSVADTGSDTKSHKPEPQQPEAVPTTILVFRDGHQMEIGNYAIVGDTLYDLAGNYQTHKIQLADLDLEKTVKANEDRGYDFRLPQGN